MSGSDSSNSSRSRRRRGRSARRAEGHHAAQAEAEGLPVAIVPDHPLVPPNMPEPITDADALAELVAHVRAVGSFAFDTEFIGEESYYPKICLVQIATQQRVALVDPLAGLDLGGVWALIVDPAIETIVHAGAQDLEPAARLLGRPPANIFDIQVGAGFAGRPYPLGLRPLVQEFIGARLGKALTFTQWDRRPLSAVHARYAADDVRYLPAAREMIGRDLESFGHAGWAREECDAMSEISRYLFDPDARVARLTGARAMRPKSAAVLRELVVLRDRLAREQDIPPRTLLKDDVIVRVAKEHVRSPEQLASIKGCPRPFAERHGLEIVELTRRALAERPPRDAVRLPLEESSADRVRIDSLWTIAAGYCWGRGVDPALVGNRRRVAEFYFELRKRRDPMRSPLAHGWRRELVGALLEELIAGRAAVRFAWEGGRLRAIADG